ncbi:NAD-dependent epimerase/dehydratase family protein [Paraburkholderia sp. J67]|uniref:NAD-dependent epimerase/dehydratase family protein n=1 Tax=Paraburkholderia sp. J67 TaxID=2805435 RepID=UPI002ABE76CD|nr:NAD-dependent epimerase/dehydratase family protein [Paraburkholderia sp. J67]
MAKVLITGADGFTGHYLCAHLEEAGHEVIGVSRQPKNSRWIAADLLDRQTIARVVAAHRPSAVVHLAAIPHVAHGDIGELYAVNVVGTRNLLAALAQGDYRPDAVLLASSANVYGNAAQGTIDESVEPLPVNDYAISKLAAEHVARVWQAHLPITIVRPFNYTGVGQRTSFLLPKIVDHFRQRANEIELGNLNVVRDFSDVRDITRTYAHLLKSAVPGKTYNVCSGTGHSLLDVIHLVQDLSGHKLEIKVNPAFVRSNEVAKLVGSARLLRDDIGVNGHTPLKETLRWMLESEL